MPVKIKGTIKFKKKMKKMIPDARSKWAILMKRSIVDIIVEKITSGLSPVRGQNRYKKYSKKYSKKKGRTSPVDLVDSGDMLNNMRARITKEKDVVIEFPDKEQRDKAFVHNSGKGKMPQRKILPSGNETFKADIMKKIVGYMNVVIKRITK